MSKKYTKDGKVYGFMVDGSVEMSDHEFQTFKLNQELEALNMISNEDLTQDIIDRKLELESILN